MNNANHMTNFPLAFAAQGDIVSLVEIRAGDKLRKRLADLGLTIGMDIRVIAGETTGPMILAVKNDSRLALGRGMAQKIMVKYAQGGE